jgi:hypothetical protein
VGEVQGAAAERPGDGGSCWVVDGDDDRVSARVGFPISRDIPLTGKTKIKVSFPEISGIPGDEFYFINSRKRHKTQKCPIL